MMIADLTNLEHAERLFRFLQGDAPKGYRCDPPKLDAEEAWTVLWFIVNQHHKYSDDVQRCEVCGDLYDSSGEGGCLDFGESPYNFCGDCVNGKEYQAKNAEARPNGAR